MATIVATKTDTDWQTITTAIHRIRRIRYNEFTISTTAGIVDIINEVFGCEGSIQFYNKHTSNTATLKIYVSNFSIDEAGNPIDNPIYWKQVGADITIPANGVVITRHDGAYNLLAIVIVGSAQSTGPISGAVILARR